MLTDFACEAKNCSKKSKRLFAFFRREKSQKRSKNLYKEFLNYFVFLIIFATDV